MQLLSGRSQMPKNIVIISDGTGQAGGINFDEARTNVYKLYRACRVGPDTRIDPSEQVAFYDPGLGSAADGGHFKVGWLRTFYNLASRPPAPVTPRTSSTAVQRSVGCTKRATAFSWSASAAALTRS